MTLSELRADKKAAEWWAARFNDPVFQLGIWKMLNEMHPLRFVETSPVTQSSAEKRLGQIEGYEMALERLRLCAQFAPKLHELPEATFPDPNAEEPKDE